MAIPDLTRPVDAVSKAIQNLVMVGNEMVASGGDGDHADTALQRDMPLALSKVETAASLLQEAAALSQVKPNSKITRQKLIEGSRFILQGTSSVLFVFDEFEVRKIVNEFRKILDYLAVVEVIESMEDLVQFVRDISPCLSKVNFFKRTWPNFFHFFAFRWRIPFLREKRILLTRSIAKNFHAAWSKLKIWRPF